jgi:hypothetical protein
VFFKTSSIPNLVKTMVRVLPCRCKVLTIRHSTPRSVRLPSRLRLRAHRSSIVSDSIVSLQFLAVDCVCSSPVSRFESTFVKLACTFSAKLSLLSDHFPDRTGQLAGGGLDKFFAEAAVRAQQPSDIFRPCSSLLLIELTCSIPACFQLLQSAFLSLLAGLRGRTSLLCVNSLNHKSLVL